MSTHRFQDALTEPTSTALASSFVFCPVAAEQLAAIQEIYRIAAELTREQMQPSRFLQRLEFSLN
jgi:hypothetical protein